MGDADGQRAQQHDTTGADAPKYAKQEVAERAGGASSSLLWRVRLAPKMMRMTSVLAAAAEAAKVPNAEAMR